MSRTPPKPVPKVPGYWVKFVSNVVEQLPRPGEEEGMIDQTTVEGWLGNKEGLRKALAQGLLPQKEVVALAEKFVLLADLGILEVPADYDHATCLGTFKTRHRQEFYYYDDDITDENFGKATVKLTPGRRLRVYAFKQVVLGTTTSRERLAFLVRQKAVLTGAQGASLVWEQKRDQLPKRYWYASFDEEEALWEDADGDRRLSRVLARSDGGFGSGLSLFREVWDGDDAFLCFCDE